MADENIIACCGKPLEFKLADGKFWQNYIPKIANCGECEAYYEKKGENDFAYKLHEDEKGFDCTECGQEISRANVAHSKRDGVFALSGSGKVEYESVPYCSNCEEKPSFHGKVIPA